MIASLFTQSGRAIYNYENYTFDLLNQYFENIVSIPEQNGDYQCLPAFRNIVKKKHMDIRYALGYFDDSETGKERVWGGINYGIAPSLDIDVFHSMRRFLTSPCKNTQQKACGFSELGDPQKGKVVLHKNLIYFGEEITVSLSLTHASASESFLENTGVRKYQQKELTLQSEENYFEGIGVADVVFYNGHSRNGGGPDFNPPRLNRLNKPNYEGYYKIKKPGITRVLQKIKASKNKDFILGFFSCYSNLHFYKALTQTNPKQKLILSMEEIDYFDTLKASMGYLEGILRGQCGSVLSASAKHGPRIVNGFKDFRIK